MPSSCELVLEQGMGVKNLFSPEIPQAGRLHGEVRVPAQDRRLREDREVSFFAAAEMNSCMLTSYHR